MIRLYDDGYPMLLGYQSRWMHETAPIAICEKSRRIGLSWGDAAERVVYAGAGAGNVFYMSFNRDMTETYIRDCADWAEHFQEKCGKVVEDFELLDKEKIPRFRLPLASGTDIVALASNPRVLRSKGKPGDRLVVDEAAFCDDLAELIKAAIAVTQLGGMVRIISTHNGADSEFNLLIDEVRARKPAGYAVHRITLDDAIADGYARRVCSIRGDEWHDEYAALLREQEVAKYRYREDADEELFCIPKLGAGVWLSRALVKSRMKPALIRRYTGTREFNLLPEPTRRLEVEGWLKSEIEPLLAALTLENRHVFGQDFGRSGDLSVFAPLEIGPTLHRTCPFMVEMRNVPHMQQLQILTFICDRLPRFAGGAMDARGNGNFLAEAAGDKYGSMIDPVMPTEAWYREHMPPYKASLEDGTFTIVSADVKARLFAAVRR